MKGKGAGDSTSSGAQEKQLGEDHVEAKTSGAPSSQATDKGILIKPKPAAKESN
jgi:hypothetical protein